MEEMVAKPGVFARMFNLVSRADEEAQFEVDDYSPSGHLSLHQSSRYHVTVRRQITSFNDAIQAADGVKRGEQQVLNLSLVPEDLREKIKDFLAGVNYAAEGTWEELGENVYMLAPASAYVEVAAATR